MAASGPDRTAAICYAVGWTQHTTGVQMIRAATILQLLLGNIGRPGGGILALRGHASIQGSTDIPTLYNLLPGYLNMPERPEDARHAGAITSPPRSARRATGSTSPSSSSACSRPGSARRPRRRTTTATTGSPRSSATTRTCRCSWTMAEGKIKGLLAMGQNPAVGGQNAGYQRQALAKLDWLVVRDLYETETATFWKDSPEAVGRRPEARGDRHRGLPPARRRRRRDGRHLHEHPAAAAVARPRGRPARRRPVRHLVHRPPRPPAQGALRGEQAARATGRSRRSLWDYIDPEENAGWRIKDEPSAARILKEINGYHVAGGLPVRGLRRPEGRRLDRLRRLDLQRGLRARRRRSRDGHNHAANRQGDDWVALGWGFAWPANRRVMYNRAVGRPRGRPLAQGGPPGASVRQRGEGLCLLGRGRERPRPREPGKTVRGAGSGSTSPTSRSPSRRPRRRDPDGLGLDFHDGASPFIMKADGKGWLFAPSGLVDGPLPTHYEPYESPVSNLLYPGQAVNPAVKVFDTPGNPYATVGLGRVPLRALDLPPDRAPPERLDEPLAPLAGRAAARAVRRDQPRARGGAGGRQPRPRGDRHAPRRRSTPRPWSPAASAPSRSTARPSTTSACPGTGATRGSARGTSSTTSPPWSATRT